MYVHVEQLTFNLQVVLRIYNSQFVFDSIVFAFKIKLSKKLNNYILFRHTLDYMTDATIIKVYI